MGVYSQDLTTNRISLGIGQPLSRWVNTFKGPFPGDFTSLTLAPEAFQAGATSHKQTQIWCNDLELSPLLWNKQNWGKNPKIS